jgi:hypothetical protein
VAAAAAAAAAAVAAAVVVEEEVQDVLDEMFAKGCVAWEGTALCCAAPGDDGV